jgi:hypothetical protein
MFIATDIFENSNSLCVFVVVVVVAAAVSPKNKLACGRAAELG